MVPTRSPHGDLWDVGAWRLSGPLPAAEPRPLPCPAPSPPGQQLCLQLLQAALVPEPPSPLSVVPHTHSC